MGPLTVSKRNPRYFADPSGRVVYLTGAHTWNNLVDMDSRNPPHPFNFDAYLDFLKAHNHNFTRLWAWEVAQPNDERDTPERKFAAPQAWRRTGPGIDVTGQPKFDLNKLDHTYFERLRTRVLAARNRRLYVAVMLFEGWSAQFSPGRMSHPFYSSNNINGTQYLRDVRDIYSLKHRQITRLQQRYLQTVLDTVNDLDNVIFEIANESGSYSTDWQSAMLVFIRCYEATKPIQHPIGMTYQYKGGTNATLFNSDANWIAPGGESGNYLSRPEPSTGLKVVISDSDHLEGSSLSEPMWVFKNLFAGLNTLYMDRYFGPDALNTDQDRLAPEIRAAMGQVGLISTLFDLGSMVPAPNLVTTGYALREAKRILVLATDETKFNIDLRTMPEEMQLEWFDIVTGGVRDGGRISGGISAVLQSPYRHGAVLHIRDAGSHRPSLFEIENKARAIRKASMQYTPWLIRSRLMAKPYLDTLIDGYRPLILALFLSFVGGIVVGFAVNWFFGSRSYKRPVA